MNSTQKEQPLSSFPQQLRLERTRRGWSQARLAEMLNTEAKTISRWELGQATPASYLREKLSDLLGLSLQELGLLETLEDFPVTALFDPAIPLLPGYPLIGRDAQLVALRQRLQESGNVALSALSGLPGAGKTALAVALANNPELRAHFNDGILWAGLGPEPNIIGHILRWGALLGLDTSTMEVRDIKAGFTALHKALNTQTMLLVIDDVWRPEDALALKVGGPTCAHLITTRFAWVATQLAADGAFVIEELSTDEGITLVRQLAPQISEQEPQRIRDLVQIVGGLPLALTLIGNWLRVQSYRSHPRRVSQALQLLHNDAIARLDLQESRSDSERHSTQPGAALISLRSIISVSVEQLQPDERASLYALSVFPPKPNTFSEEAALAVTNGTAEILDQLIATGLLQINGPEQRYMLHPTITDYACLQLEQSDAFDQAYQRLVNFFTKSVERSTDFAELEKDYANILAALDAAFSQDGITELPRLAISFTPFLLAQGLYSTAETHLLHAYQTATFLGDEAGQAHVLATLEQVHHQQNTQPGGILETV